MSGEIHCERNGDIAVLILSNPERLNAINAAMWSSLQQTLQQLHHDPHLRCLIVRGAGGQAFAAGGDIEEFATMRASVDDALYYHEQLVAPALEAIRSCPIPSIAAIQGPCIGGGLAIAACCDLRIAGLSARFGAPINRLGFSMYPGEIEALLELVGPSVVLEILLEGRILDATEALQRGLLGRVVADDMLMDAVQQSAENICKGAPLVASWHKQWVRRLLSSKPLDEVEKRRAFAFIDTEDYREGIDAFCNKRPPVFKGR